MMERRNRVALEQMPKFTPEGRKRWEQIPADIRPKLLDNVYCVYCGDETTITNFSGSMQGADLVLVGECLKCHESVARVIEA